MKNFAKLEDLVALAQEKGFRVRAGRTQAELWYPGASGSDSIWHGGSQYSTAHIVLSSEPGIGYGCNDAFYGPYHHGYVPLDSMGAKIFLSYFNQ